MVATATPVGSDAQIGGEAKGRMRAKAVFLPHSPAATDDIRRAM